MLLESSVCWLRCSLSRRRRRGWKPRTGPVPCSASRATTAASTAIPRPAFRTARTASAYRAGLRSRPAPPLPRPGVSSLAEMQRSLTFEGVLNRLRRRRVNRRAFQEFGRSLSLIVDREALEASVAARIRELFDPDRMVILEPDWVGTTFLPGFSFGFADADLAGLQVPARGKLTRWLAVNETCLVLDRQPGVQEYLDPAERELLERLRLNLVVP